VNFPLAALLKLFAFDMIVLLPGLAIAAATVRRPHSCLKARPPRASAQSRNASPIQETWPFRASERGFDNKVATALGTQGSLFWRLPRSSWPGSNIPGLILSRPMHPA
jgi:hypothetical protein